MCNPSITEASVNEIASAMEFLPNLTQLALNFLGYFIRYMVDLVIGGTESAIQMRWS